MTTTPRAGVIIATRDRPEALRSALEAADRALRVVRAEYIVVDQSENEASHDVCRQFPDVQYVRSTSVGISHNRNRGAERAQSEWLLFLDDDAVLPDEFGRELQGVLARAEGVSLVAPLCVDPGGRLMTDAPCERQARIRVANPWCASGGCLAVRRSVFLSIGGFDERFGAGRRWGSAEETDLVLRLIQDGRACVVEPSLVFAHPRPLTRGRVGRRRAYRYGLGLGALFRLHLLRSDDPKWRGQARSFMLHPLWEIVHAPARRTTALRLLEFVGRWLGLLLGPTPPHAGGRIGHSVASIRALAKTKAPLVGSSDG